MSAFLRECTPGYFNNDGEEVTDDEGVLQPRSYAGELYGLGFYAFDAAGGLAVKERFVGLDGRTLR